jgi:phosphatidylserine/phosphatidylglycerophosphate/cardiolipin synthase-like enzyme
VAVSLSSVPALLARVASARDVAFGAYFLPPSAVRDALVAAARRGAHVAVTLQADPYRNPHGARLNRDAARALRHAGAHVTLLRSDTVPFHLKAAVCDGAAYLDDRNWTKRGPETVVRDDDPRDVALVRAALAGRGGSDDALATRKDEALRREIALVDHARGAVTVETERVATSPLTRALLRHAARGARTTLIVARAAHRSRTESHALAALRAGGVDIREGGTNEKLALAGGTAWIGSGNATGASGRSAGQVEWGMRTRVRALVGAVRAALARDLR